MKKVVVISDSFKGSLSSKQIIEIANDCIHDFYPDCRVIGLPVADGGEGTVDCFLDALGGERIEIPVCGPWGENMTACYGRIGDTAVVEMAAAAGLPLVGERKDPAKTTTYGVGMQIRHAVEHGARHVILGLGGSATNDGGCGCAAALGVRFFDADGNEFCPVGETLRQISRVDCSGARMLLKDVTVEAMCDIDNPLCGPKGAAAVFAPQKGADAQSVAMLDTGLSHMADIISGCLGLEVANLPGAGAAGGFGAGAVAWLNAKLRPGIEVVLDMVSFADQLKDCDLVITGEGRLDGQSMAGKVPVGVARRAKGSGVPVIAIVGILGDGAYAAYGEGITAIFNTNRMGMPFEVIKEHGEEDYRHSMEDIIRFMRAMKAEV